MSNSFQPFHVVGNCLGFILKDGYLPKYLKLEVAGQEYWLKIPKMMRESMVSKIAIAEGCAVEVWGKQQRKGQWDKLKLELTDLQWVGQENPNSVLESEKTAKSALSAIKSGKSRILVCQKSNCWKKGGKQVYDALQTRLRDRNLEDTIQIQLTGCLKECKHAPNLVVMPDKARYHDVSPQGVDALLDKHFACLTS